MRTEGAAPGEQLWMIIDPATREAYRCGDDPRTSGPLFFTTRERLAEYARTAGIEEYQVHAVPGGVLARMRGKPYWLDGRRAG